MARPKKVDVIVTASSVQTTTTVTNKADKIPEPQITDARLIAGREIDDETALRDAREAALIEQRVAVKPDAKGNIDERMAALLEDHIEMGVRKG